jgi:hypothetical protein
VVEVMGTVLLIVTLFAEISLKSTSSHGQSKASHPEIDSLVRQLSWNSVGGEGNGVWRIFPVGHAAKRLVKIGKPATPQLLQVLNDEERGVAAHLILTEIWEVKSSSFRNWVEGNEIEVAYFNHVYNGLRWTYVFNWKNKSVSHRVDSVDLATNSQKWKRKLARRP